MDDSAAARRQQLDRAIELKAFEIACAEAIVSQWSSASERGWLLSMIGGGLGTALAVTRGRTARQWAEQVSLMRRELVELQIERRLA
ncbi:hypothetical protein DB30_03991 [Enhygromyxa salina]|uniref:Uncharacterized protein n=1 Tax=Enhygromyxa salina TaxID=215803 RepID=A0A0C1ZGR3_9BACT|nr:hypothetical protein [Enhygromyxa salina]KIG16829.1 hypothetical protein DB30_03991 [Enhygromyxa salina]